MTASSTSSTGSTVPEPIPLRVQGIRAIRAFLARSPEGGALIGFFAVFIFFSLTAPLFLTQDSISSIVTTQAIRGIVAVGIAFLMMSGEFDLSVGSNLAVCGLTFLALTMNNVPIVLAAVLAVLAGAFMGLINGLILIWTRIPSFIVTLGTLQAYRAIALTVVSGGRILRYADYSSNQPIIYVHPLVIIAILLGVIGALYFGRPIVAAYWREFQRSSGFARTGAAIRLIFVAGVGIPIIICALVLIVIQLRDLNTLVPINFFDFLNGRFDPNGANFRTSIVWWLVIVAIFTVILTQTRYGSASLATGGNPGAARAQGIPVDRIRVINFVISGALAGLAGVIEVGRAQLIFPNTGEGLELEVIASAVIGGTLLAGGYGSIIGATLGVLITGMLRTGLVLLSVPATLFQGFIGVILIITVIINTTVRRQR
jgi:ribose/xylose/arabinose/galactoside ABC-type transport system permease subunit